MDGKNRGEDPRFLAQRFDRFEQLLAHRDVWDEADMRAFLLTPREEFVTAENLDRAYEWHHLNIGFGVTITGPHTVARMTNSLEIRRGDKVLESAPGPATSRPIFRTSLPTSGRSRSSPAWPSVRAPSMTR